jgi:predicted lipoprotein
VTGSAQAAVRALGDGQLFTRAFADKEQDAVNLLVNQMVNTIEAVATGRMARLLAARRPGELEGQPSGLALAIPRTLIEGTAQVYLGATGPGLSDLVRGVSPPIDRRAHQAFAAAGAALQALGRAPLPEVLAQRPAVEAAARTVKELELALKVDVAGALGVTLTFVGGDGD